MLGNIGILLLAFANRLRGVRSANTPAPSNFQITINRVFFWTSRLLMFFSVMAIFASTDPNNPMSGITQFFIICTLYALERVTRY
jgi:hypothetical protein